MKHLFITGASSGIGKAIAENLHSKGFALTLFARNAQALQEIKNQLGERVFIATLFTQRCRI
jgi:NADP-dependent 3-hydroxy acid dehydrogenase YdfG